MTNYGPGDEQTWPPCTGRHGDPRNDDRDELSTCTYCKQDYIEEGRALECGDVVCPSCYDAEPVRSNCCGAALLPYEQPMCSECKDHCEGVK